MAKAAVARVRQGTIGVNKVTGAIRFTVPHGTKLVDAVRALSTVDLNKALLKVPKGLRGCEACHSGCPFDIHEDFDPVINVRLGGG